MGTWLWQLFHNVYHVAYLKYIHFVFVNDTSIMLIKKPSPSGRSRWTYLQDRNRDKDIETKLWTWRGERGKGVGWTERLGLTHIHYWWGSAHSLSGVWLFATPWTVAHGAPLSMGFSRQEYWSGLPFPPPGALPHPGIEHETPVSSALQADSLPLSHPDWVKPIHYWCYV